MNFDRITRWISIVANAGVLLGLVLVALELQQNSDLMQIQIGQSRADSAMTSLEQSFNSPYIPSILAKIQRGEDLDDEEWIRFVGYFRAGSRNQDNVLSQYDAGMLEGNTPRSVAGYVCEFVGASPRHLDAWSMTRSGYTDRYIEFVESALENCD